MRIHDGFLGSVLLLLSLSVLWHLQDFPEPVGQPYGAALFPGLVAGALAVCALALIVQGLRYRNMAWIDADAGLRSPRRRLGFFMVIGALVFYILCAETLGFLLSGTIMLTALLWVFAVHPLWIVPIAVTATLIIHTTFYKILKVPLPWGVLQAWVW